MPPVCVFMIVCSSTMFSCVWQCLTKTLSLTSQYRFIVFQFEYHTETNAHSLKNVLQKTVHDAPSTKNRRYIAVPWIHVCSCLRGINENLQHKNISAGIGDVCIQFYVICIHWIRSMHNRTCEDIISKHT